MATAALKSATSRITNRAIECLIFGRFGVPSGRPISFSGLSIRRSGGLVLLCTFAELARGRNAPRLPLASPFIHVRAGVAYQLAAVLLEGRPRPLNCGVRKRGVPELDAVLSRRDSPVSRRVSHCGQPGPVERGDCGSGALFIETIIHHCRCRRRHVTEFAVDGEEVGRPNRGQMRPQRTTQSAHGLTAGSAMVKRSCDASSMIIERADTSSRQSARTPRARRCTCQAHPAPFSLSYLEIIREQLLNGALGGLTL